MYILYLASALASGYCIALHLRRDATLLEHTAMGIGIGYLLSGWITYIVSYFAKVMLGLENPKIYGNIAAVLIMLVVSAVGYKYKKTSSRKNNKKEYFFFMLLFAAVIASMFYVFRIEDGMLKSGVSVFSDYAPHTAVIRSFSFHDNFPTQYPHYGGQDMKYHFMFQFFCGNLEFLGMPVDFAFNIPSAAALWGFLVLLYFFAKRIAGSVMAGIITCFMFFCRSSLAAFVKITTAIAGGNWMDIFTNAEFIGFTEHEDWGLWNYNVFLNQRHLALGLLICVIVLVSFIDYLDWVDENGEGIKGFLKGAFAMKDSWLPVNPVIAVCMGAILGSLSFWNGAVVVAALLILFGFAVFAKHKLDFAITAGITLLFTFIQTCFFIKEDGPGVALQFGFLAENKTIGGSAVFLVQLAGFFFIGVLLFMFIMRGKKRVLTIAFSLPVVFAFTVSLTPDITVNHKYIMISVIFLNIIWAYVLVLIFRKNTLGAVMSIILLFTLTCTGMYDMITIYNKDKNMASINLKSGLTEWLKENVKEDEMVLVNQDSMSEATLSGVMMYNGWPYYAWSAGYDTDYRDRITNEIYAERNPEMLKALLKREGIDYIVVDKYNNRDSSAIDASLECVYNKNGDKVYKVN